MRVVRWLALLVLAFPLAAAGDLKSLFPDLVQQAQTQVTPIVTINGGAEPGVFVASDGVVGSLDSTAPLENLSSQVASQFQRFPVGSTVAAFTFNFDPELNVFTRSTEGLGPLLSDRAQTIGKGKINFSFAYSHVKFDVFEGEDLNDLDLGFAGGVQGATSGNSSAQFNGGGSLVDFRSDFQLVPGQQIKFTDVGGGTIDDGNGTLIGFHSSDFTNGSVSVGGINSVLDAELSVDVFAFFLNYGVTDWLDVGAVVPLMYVQGSGQVTTFGLSDPGTGVPLGPVTTSQEDDDSFGFGDIILRAKARLFTSPFVDAGLRGDVTLPTGNDDDFRGYGRPAFGPTLLLSKTFGMFSPHANFGLNFRTDDHHQDSYRWAAGLDLQPFQVLTVTADFIGESLLNRDQEIGEDIYGFAAGLKVNPWSRLVLSGSALVRLNDEGLRADVIPSVAVEYTF